MPLYAGLEKRLPPPHSEAGGYLPLAQASSLHEQEPGTEKDEGTWGGRVASWASMASWNSGKEEEESATSGRKVCAAALAAVVLVVAGSLWFSPYELALQRQYACPNPHLAIPSSLLTPRHLSAPIALPSTSPDFALSLAYDTRVCNAFTLSISRLDKAHCAAVEAAITPSEDPALSEWIRTSLGPDAFIIQVDGAERRMEDTPTRYAGNCEYAFDFRLNNAGPAWVNVTHSNEDYHGFREVSAVPGERQRPPLLMRALVAAPLELNLCDARCQTHYAPRLGFAVPPSVPPAAPAAEEGAALPNCRERARDGTLGGSYLPTRAVDQLYPPFALPVSFSPTQTRTSTGYSAFVPAQCAWDHAGLRFRDHQACTRRERRVLFIGDSHGRAVFDITKVRLEGEGQVASSSLKMEERNASIGALFMEFHWDPFLLIPLTCELVEGFDAIVVSAGTHTAAFACPTTSDFVSTFEAKLAAFPALLQRCSPSTPPAKLVFLTMPVQHQHLHDHDCRTGPRVSHWNRELTRVAKREGWEVVDVEGYSRPNAVDQRIMDGIHYLALDAAEPVADDFIDRLGICDED
ncbi:hypothetical protein JCM10450v2_007755 [Rhodotorula kratochvilovae]